MRNGLRCRRSKSGISTVAVTGIIFLILTLSVLGLLVSSVLGHNAAINAEMEIDDAKAREKVVLTELGISGNNTLIAFVRVNNTGTIEVRIRGIYESNNTMTILLFDPSLYMDTYIEPGGELLIRGPDDAAITRFQPSARLTLVTERGTKTSDYEGRVLYGQPNPPEPYDTSRFYIGPLELMFTAFYYKRVSQEGAFDSTDDWHPGWSIPRSYGYSAWKITVRNIDNRTITVNKFSSFTIVPNESPPSDERTWYLEPVNMTEGTQVLIPDQVEEIVYIWDTSADAKAQQIYSVSCRCLVFLTFYGWFRESDGSATTYAQTIPFEAAITVI